MWKASTCGFNCDKAYWIFEYLDIKSCSCKKYLFDKLVLACEEEILDTKGTSVRDHSYVKSIVYNGW